MLVVGGLDDWTSPPWNLSFQDLEIFGGSDETNEKVEEVEAGRAGRKDDGWTASPTEDGGEEGSRSQEPRSQEPSSPEPGSMGAPGPLGYR